MLHILKDCNVHCGVTAGSKGNVIPGDDTEMLPLDLSRLTRITSSAVHHTSDVANTSDHIYAQAIPGKYPSFADNIIVYIAGFVAHKAVKTIVYDICSSSLVAQNGPE